MNFEGLVDTPACNSALRNPLLPKVFEARNHPLHPSVNPGRTFVALIRASEPAMDEMRRYEEGLSVPLGRKAELDGKGLIQMVPGDYLFARDTTGSGDSHNDVLLAWVVGRSLYNEDDVQALDNATSQAIGHEESRTSTVTQFESLNETSPVQKNTRCYTLAQSFETIPAIVAPCANGKWKGQTTEYHTIVRDLTKATSRMAMTNLECATPSIQDTIRERSEMLGLPHIGSDGNYAYPTIQCNIAAAATSNSGLQKDMGDFGGAHRDDRDSIGHYTNMIANSKLPEGYDPGYFHLLLLGIYVTLQNHIGFNFQGHWKHGGSAPTCPPGTDLDPLATRFVLISYPPTGMVSSNVRHRIAELPRPNGKNDAIYVTPEMTSAEFDTSLLSRPNRRANLVSDGHVIMEPRSYANSVARMLFNEIKFQLNQGPSHIGLQLDPNRFFDSLSFLTPNGRDTVDQWPQAIGTRHGGSDTKQQQVRYHQAESRWTKHAAKTARLVPFCFSKFAGYIPGEGTDRETPEIEMKDDGDDHRSTVAPPENVSARATSANVDQEKSGDATTKPPWRKVQSAIPRELDQENGGSGASCDTSSAETTDGHKEGNHPPSKNDKPDRKGKGKGKGKGKKAAAKTSQGDGGKRKRDGLLDDNADEADHPQKRLKSLQGRFKFTSDLTYSILETEVHQLRRTMTDVIYTDALPDAANLLIDARAHIIHHPLDPSAILNARTIVQGCQAMAEVQSDTALFARKGRLRSIDAQVRLWRWLDVDVRESVIERMENQAANPHPDLSWLSRLTESVKAVYTSRTATKLFNPVDFGVASNTSTVTLNTYTLINVHRGRLFVEGNELTMLVGSSVVAVVSNWVGEYNDVEQKRAWFVDTIAEHVGEELLTLDLTWNMVTNFKPIFVLPREIAYNHHDNRAVLDPFIASLQEHPISDPSTPEGLLYAIYCELLNEDLQPQDVTNRILSISPIWSKFNRMLKLSVDYLANPDQTFGNKFQIALKDNEDYYLPFRDDAASRRRSAANDGPYAKGTIDTVQGIFSAVVWRACTYRSEFSEVEGMVFKDSSDLFRRVDKIIQKRGGGLKRDDAFFCKKDAYGQPAGRRSLEYASTYWKNLQELNWCGLATSNPSFSRCIEFFRPPGKNQAKLFPQLGGLGSFMLVGDLARAGICQTPSAQDVATHMVENGRGSLAGLRTLGLGPDNGGVKPEKVDIAAQGLQELFEITSATLQSLRYAGSIDFIVLEHMLCKFQRALVHGLLD
ncbi:hypothetical protein BKA70DRAFT_1444399 [Coprinopsis sp. MPI-PUGE-AT-0042]|nr:hypothetical protein BKA70DRAFT_1444399 [Coprinopsis sp. MPI-PUGE-AT-0042]